MQDEIALVRRLRAEVPAEADLTAARARFDAAVADLGEQHAGETAAPRTAAPRTAARRTSAPRTSAPRTVAPRTSARQGAGTWRLIGNPLRWPYARRAVLAGGLPLALALMLGAAFVVTLTVGSPWENTAPVVQAP